MQKTASITLYGTGATIAGLALIGGTLWSPARLTVALAGCLLCVLAQMQGRSGYVLHDDGVVVHTGFGHRVLRVDDVERAVVRRTRLSAFPTLVLTDGSYLENRFLRVWLPPPQGVDTVQAGRLFEQELHELVGDVNRHLDTRRP